MVDRQPDRPRCDICHAEMTDVHPDAELIPDLCERCAVTPVDRQPVNRQAMTLPEQLEAWAVNRERCHLDPSLLREAAARVRDLEAALRAVAEMPVRWPTDETAAMQEFARAALAPAEKPR